MLVYRFDFVRPLWVHKPSYIRHTESANIVSSLDTQAMESPEGHREQQFV